MGESFGPTVHMALWSRSLSSVKSTQTCVWKVQKKRAETKSLKGLMLKDPGWKKPLITSPDSPLQPSTKVTACGDGPKTLEAALYPAGYGSDDPCHYYISYLLTCCFSSQEPPVQPSLYRLTEEESDHVGGVGADLFPSSHEGQCSILWPEPVSAAASNDSSTHWQI